MKLERSLAWVPALAAVLLAGCGSGSMNPSSAAATGVATTTARYFDALRRGDPQGVLATLAPDYHFDGTDAATRAHAFDIPFGLTYQTLNYRIDALTTAGNTATTGVTLNFVGDLNLEFAHFGRPRVNGSSRLVLELEPRGAEWRITAVRVVHTQFAQPNTIAPILRAVTANGATSLQVAPGTPVTLAGKATASFLLIGALGTSFASQSVAFDVDVPFAVQVSAPPAAGRYLATVFSFTQVPNANIGTLDFLSGDLVTIPVTVTSP